MGMCRRVHASVYVSADTEESSVPRRPTSPTEALWMKAYVYLEGTVGDTWCAAIKSSYTFLFSFFLCCRTPWSPGRVNSPRAPQLPAFIGVCLLIRLSRFLTIVKLKACIYFLIPNSTTVVLRSTVNATRYDTPVYSRVYIGYFL